MSITESERFCVVFRDKCSLSAASHVDLLVQQSTANKGFHAPLERMRLAS